MLRRASWVSYCSSPIRARPCTDSEYILRVSSLACLKTRTTSPPATTKQKPMTTNASLKLCCWQPWTSLVMVLLGWRIGARLFQSSLRQLYPELVAGIAWSLVVNVNRFHRIVQLAEANISNGSRDVQNKLLDALGRRQQLGTGQHLVRELGLQKVAVEVALTHSIDDSEHGLPFRLPNLAHHDRGPNPLLIKIGTPGPYLFIHSSIMSILLIVNLEIFILNKT